MRKEKEKSLDYYRNNLDIEMEKEFAVSNNGDCIGLYRKYFNHKDFFCIDISYEGEGTFWFALCTGTEENGMESVDYLYESDEIRELTNELVFEYERVAETMIKNEYSKG